MQVGIKLQNEPIMIVNKSALRPFHYITCNVCVHPSIEGIGTPWVCAQESLQYSVLLDTKSNKIAVDNEFVWEHFEF